MSKAAVSVSALPGLSAADRTSRRQRIFLPAALAATALAIIGFWRTYFGPLLAGAVHEPVVIHVHAVVMVTWLVLVMMRVG